MNLLKDNVHKLYFKYFFPTIGGALSTSIYILFDTIFIGQGVGPEGLAALNIALPIYSIYFGTGLLVGVGGSTLFSIERGRGREERANKIFTLSMALGGTIAIVYTLISFVFLKQIAFAFGATTEILPLVKEYMIVVAIGTIPFVMGSVISPFIRADKAPKRVMVAVIFSGFLNILLDYIFVFPLKMGMKGAAIATVISYTVSFLIMASHFLSKNNTLSFSKSYYNSKYIKRIFKCGAPSLLVEISSGFVILIFNHQILRILGEDGVTAYSIISNTAIIVVALFNGVCQTIQPLISTNYGAGEEKRTREFKSIAIKTALIIGTIACVFCFLFPDTITNVFVKPTNRVLIIAREAIRYYVFAFIILGINMVLGAYFQAIELGREAFILVLLRGLLLVSVLVYILPKFLDIRGVWLSVPIAEALTLIVALILNNFNKSYLKK